MYALLANRGPPGSRSRWAALRRTSRKFALRGLIGDYWCSEDSLSLSFRRGRTGPDVRSAHIFRLAKLSSTSPQRRYSARLSWCVGAESDTNGLMLSCHSYANADTKGNFCGVANWIWRGWKLQTVRSCTLQWYVPLLQSDEAVVCRNGRPETPSRTTSPKTIFVGSIVWNLSVGHRTPARCRSEEASSDHHHSETFSDTTPQSW